MEPRGDGAEQTTLPAGTVTFLFTDIEGSTRLVQELGDGYRDTLAAHRRTLRDVFTRYDGVEVDTQGDSFFVAFARATDAVQAAAATQEALATGPVRVRIGIHTGEPVVTPDGYVGIDVHRAARIMAAGHGGQVLVSEATGRLLDASFPLQDLGHHRLKDLSDPQRLYQLGAGDFPPLRTLYHTNLPTQSAPLVGRTRELGEIGELLRAHRLVTLTGPGGSGKTRLALQVAADAVDDFPDGVTWISLQALREPDLVEPAIATALGADDDIAQHVGNQRVLLLLDNFEQVVDAAPTVSRLLAGTAHARVLVTSREPLHLESEQRYPVEPLPDGDAVGLFVQRASAVDPAFQANGAVYEICRRLDGLPLAIELAAARVALLDPDELLVRLDRRLPLLASRSRDAPARQRTLRAAIDWSYELLDADEQALFVNLSVFQGSFTTEAAEVVCGADFDLLESLVEKSLVRRWGTGQLGLLETIREYALEQLHESQHPDDLRRRHAQHFLALARAANLDGGALRPGGQRVDLGLAEIDNFRGALTWVLEQESITLGLELAVALEQLWVSGDPGEGVRWFERLLAHPAFVDADANLRAQALRVYGSALHISGDPVAAETVWNESLTIFTVLHDEHGEGVLLHRLGISAITRGDLATARALVERSDEIHRRTGDAWGRAQTVGTLGAIAREEGDVVTAIELVRESAALARTAEVAWWESGALAELACLLLDAGSTDEAEQHARDALSIAELLRDRAGRIFCVGILAGVASARGESRRAGCLWGAIEDEDAGAPLGGWRRHREAVARRIKADASLEHARGYEEGRTLSLDDAVARAAGSD